MTKSIHVAMRGDFYALGLIPNMLNPHDPRSVVDQLNEGYAHGGGWHDFQGFTVTEEDGHYAIQYPGDPVYPELARIELRDEIVVAFEHSWIMCVAADKTTRIARMD